MTIGLMTASSLECLPSEEVHVPRPPNPRPLNPILGASSSKVSKCVYVHNIYIYICCGRVRARERERESESESESERGTP